MTVGGEQHRVLGSGSSALKTSQLGFGCMGLTAFYGDPIPEDDAVEVMVHAFKNGVTHFDTAEVYTGKGEDGSIVYNETVVGKALKVMGREHVQIATKFRPDSHSATEMTPAIVLEALRASCSRLQVDFVDLYYVHRFHPMVPVEDQARCMQACLDAGLAKRIGLSEFSPDNVRAFHAVCPVTCVQQEWSLLNRDLEEDLVPACRELGIGIVAYSPLSRALLSGKVRTAEDLNAGDLRTKRYPRLSAENIPKNAALADRIVPHAERRGVTPAQLALAWVLNQGGDVVPIPGTTKVKNLNDNLAARDVKLTRAELDDIAGTIPLEEVAGDRFNGGSAKNTYREQLLAAEEPGAKRAKL